MCDAVVWAGGHEALPIDYCASVRDEAFRFFQEDFHGIFTTLSVPTTGCRHDRIFLQSPARGITAVYDMRVIQGFIGSS